MTMNRLIRLSHAVRKAVVDTKLYNPVLTGACGMASFHLMRCAKKNGISVRFVHSNFCYRNLEETNWLYNHRSFHAWIEYRGHIIDLTKSQFDERSPKVAIIPFERAIEYDRAYPGIRTPIIRDAWEWIRSWALYPDDLKNNLIVVP